MEDKEILEALKRLKASQLENPEISCEITNNCVQGRKIKLTLSLDLLYKSNSLKDIRTIENGLLIAKGAE